MAKPQDKDKAQERQNVDLITNQVTGAPVQIDPQSDPDLYQLDPELVADDVVINVVECPKLLPKGNQRNSSVRLQRGDRIKGKYYNLMVTKHKIPGLALCKNLTADYLKDLEGIREARNSNADSQLIKEIWAAKNEKDTREALKGRR